MITVILSFLAAASEALAAPKRILLLLHSFGRDFAPWKMRESAPSCRVDPRTEMDSALFRMLQNPAAKP
jgi:hypothetical protein